ncbi:MAG: hypothetical protein C4528_01165 [Gammaproteobacteria bacterium]|nr:MAG: hypothetical protein C4528_01165 [Gammaproteobacteria bacterium]
MNLVYKHEKPLFYILVVISLLIWIGVIAVTSGIALIYVAVAFIFYLFFQSAFISYLKGTAVKITVQQFPDLHERVTACCARLGISKIPDAYLLRSDGAFNAFATRFLGRNFIALYSELADALEAQPGALDFYIGHELGHIHRGHLKWHVFTWPASILPLLGAGYSRACEYTCDRYGLACVTDPNDAKAGMAALAAGAKRWRTLSHQHYAAQDTRGFWMSFHELTGDYPWLTKRMATLDALIARQPVRLPRRNIFAWLLALFVPRLGLGKGAAGGMIVLLVIVGVLAAISFPAYQEFQMRANVAGVFAEIGHVKTAIDTYRLDNNALPNSNEELNLPVTGDYGKNIQSIAVSEGGIITVTLTGALEDKSVVLGYIEGSEGEVWACESDTLDKKYLERYCQVVGQ